LTWAFLADNSANDLLVARFGGKHERSNIAVENKIGFRTVIDEGLHHLKMASADRER